MYYSLHRVTFIWIITINVTNNQNLQINVKFKLYYEIY